MTRTAVVIGTGAGGLTAAASLARRGFSVVALERAKQLGGFLNPFARRHYWFDPGVHYMGQCSPGEMVHGILGSVGVDAGELFAPMDRDGYDLLRFPDFEMRMCAGLARYRARLCEAFPADRTDIARFFELLVDFREITESRRKGALAQLARLRALPSFLYWSRRSFGELLARYFKNPRLRSVLGAQCGDYGLPPSRAPAILGTAVLLHFMEGAYFPRGGSGALRDALVESAREHGAVFRRRAEVQRIGVNAGRVTHVTLADGTEIGADVVISAIDPVLTFGRLLADADLPRRLRRKVARTRPSIGSVCLFLGMKRDLRDHGLGAFNVWDYPTWDIESLYAQALDGAEVPEQWPFFLSPNSLKDDTGTMAPPGCSTLEVLSFAPFAPFARWADLPSLKRGLEYDDLKRRVADSLLAAVEERWPGVIGDVAVEEIATPLTNIHYAGVVEGGIYGPAATPDQFGLNGFRPWTPVKGLYLAGAGVFGPGVAPCLASGVVAGKLAARHAERRFPRLLPAPRRALARALG